MVAKNPSKPTATNQFQRKYNFINGFTGQTKSMGGNTNSVKLNDIIKAGIKNKISA